MLKFFLPIVIAVIANIVISILGYQAEGNMWANHLADGQAFLENRIPENPSFPMWGYSFLATLAGPFIPIYQGIFLVVVLCLWYLVIESTQQSTIKIFNSCIVAGIVTALVLLPVIALSVSYWSNSVFIALIIFGAVVLRISALRSSNMLLVVATGVLFGLSYNIRTEGLIFCSALIIAMLVHRCMVRNLDVSVLKMVCIFLIMIVSIGPWYVYTNSVLDNPRIGTTNSAGVAYVSMGIRPDNPWGIEATDEFVWEMALEKGYASPWYEGANTYFREKFIESVKAHPVDFLKKIIKNIQLLCLQGVYLPNFRDIYGSEIDRQRLDYVNEQLKSVIGLKVNHRELEEYEQSEEVTTGITVMHRAIVYSEYFFRAAYALLFLFINAAALVLSLLTRFRHVESWFYLTISACSVLMSGLFITEPRMSTMIMPFAFWSICVTYSEFRKRVRHGFARSTENLEDAV